MEKAVNYTSDQTAPENEEFILIDPLQSTLELEEEIK